MSQVEPIGGFMLAVMIVAILTGVLSHLLAKKMPASWKIFPVGIVLTLPLSALVGSIYIFLVYTLPHAGGRIFKMALENFSGMLIFHVEAGIEFSIFALIVGPISFLVTFLKIRSCAVPKLTGES